MAIKRIFKGKDISYPSGSGVIDCVACGENSYSQVFGYCNIKGIEKFISFGTCLECPNNHSNMSPEEREIYEKAFRDRK